jgi:hypothetical protein
LNFHHLEIKRFIWILENHCLRIVIGKFNFQCLFLVPKFRQILLG